MKNPGYMGVCYIILCTFLYFLNYKIKYAIEGKIGGSSQMMLTG